MALIWKWIADHIVGICGLLLQLFKGKNHEATPAPCNTNSIAIGAGATIAGSPVVVGSNNTVNAFSTNNVTVISQVKERKPSIPTPSEIARALHDAPPLQVPQLRRNYEGLQVSWPMNLSSAADSDSCGCGEKGSILVMLKFGDDLLSRVCCPVNLNDYPALKIIKRGHPIWVTGTIRKMCNHDAIELENVKLEILS